MIKNYKELWERIQNGERDIDVAYSVGSTASALYVHFAEQGFVTTGRRTSEEEWKEQYEAYKNGKRAADISKDLGVQLATVYNHFYSFGMKINSRKPTDKQSIIDDYNAGLSYSDLAVKYSLTVTYVRFVIRSSKRV